MCDSHALEIYFDPEEPGYFVLNFWESGHGIYNWATQGIFHRVRAIWNIIRYGHDLGDMFVMDRTTLQELIDKLEALRKADTEARLRQLEAENGEC